MNVADEPRYPQVYAEDTFSFHCSKCGECCRNVKEAVMVESLDLFRLARFLQKRPDEIMAEYTVPRLLDKRGFPILLLKTTGLNDACVFLKDSRCTVHDAKPRACRLYPLSTGPDDITGEFLYYIVSKKPHHFTGKQHRARDWFGRYFTREDEDFVRMDLLTAAEIARILRKIETGHEQEIMFQILLYKYAMLEPEQDFKPQFIRNMAQLIQELKKLTKGEQTQ